jgi:hypothetical protein
LFFKIFKSRRKFKPDLVHSAVPRHAFNCKDGSDSLRAEQEPVLDAVPPIAGIGHQKVGIRRHDVQELAPAYFAAQEQAVPF